MNPEIIATINAGEDRRLVIEVVGTRAFIRQELLRNGEWWSGYFLRVPEEALFLLTEALAKACALVGQRRT